MKVVFYIDPETGRPHIHDHGVTEDEVRQILAQPGLTIGTRERSRFVLGQTTAGRYLRVLCSPRRDGPGVFVVTAYEIRGKDLKAYRRRKRRKKR